MKKIIILFASITLLGGVYFLFVNNNTSNTSQTETVNNIHGFSFTPTEGWVLWEGVSAVMDVENGGVPADKNNPDRYDSVELQKYVNSWRPESSKHLVYTLSDVDVNTRNIKTLEQYSLEKLKNPLVHNTVFISIMEGSVNYDLEQKKTERSEAKYKETDWGRILYRRAKLPGYDLVSLNIPLGKNTYIFVYKSVDTSEINTFSYIENFLEGLKISENTAQ